MKKYLNYITEKKKYIFSRVMRVKDLLDDEKSDIIYSPFQIYSWMEKYNFDLMANCLLVSDEKIDINAIDFLKLRVSSKDMINKFSFDDKSYNKDGKKIDGSEIEIIDEKTNKIYTIYLWVFRKNSNDKERARQIHGFRYEYQIRKENNLEKLSYTDKWDAEGTLNNSFLELRREEGKTIEYYNGETYSVIDGDIPESYNIVKDRKWNIKSPALGSGIDMADFLRISGYEMVDGKIQKHKHQVDSFIFCVGFHDMKKDIIEEYIINIKRDNWAKYLPDFNNEQTVNTIRNMYIELLQHKLNSKRTPTSELKWKEFRIKYSKITFNTLIKLRFKRDSKGQLRIQAGISNNNFKTLLKENKHIKIS